jgi:hypothetical protein
MKDKRWGIRYKWSGELVTPDGELGVRFGNAEHGEWGEHHRRIISQKGKC